MDFSFNLQIFHSLKFYSVLVTYFPKYVEHVSQESALSIFSISFMHDAVDPDSSD